MKRLALVSFAIILFSCVPEGAKRKINEQMAEMQNMITDQEFKKGIAFIELHKVRYGSYPGSLKNLTFQSTLDSLSLRNLDYKKLDSGYELNIKGALTTISGDSLPMTLKYPPEFWEGLGCAKSNTKE